MNNIYQGESLAIEVTVQDADGTAANLLGAKAFFACKAGTTEAVTKNCIIRDNVVSTELTAAETALMSGTYTIEIKLRDLDGKVDTLVYTTLKILRSIIPTLPV